jgi:RND family efflux transporter MFP subunit
LRKWYFDIGAHVKQRQLLAVIETPEVDQQLEQSISNLKTAKANLAFVEITRNRYQGLIKDNAVAQQLVDNAVGAYNANRATVAANEANVKQLQTLQSFEKIYAPFDGVITARNINIGDLINSGNSGTVKADLFHMAQPGTLRVYVNVPEKHSQGFEGGHDRRPHSGRVSRVQDSGKAGSHSRCHQYDNPHIADRSRRGQSIGHAAHRLLRRGPHRDPVAGLYFLFPVNTLIFRSEGLRVGVVRDGKVALTAVTRGPRLWQ